MLMMNVKKDLINSKVRSMLGKCRIAICYAEEITTLLYRLHNLVGKISAGNFKRYFGTKLRLFWHSRLQKWMYGVGYVFRFGGLWLQIHNVNILIYFCVRTHDTGRSFELIFMKFIPLMRVHSWVNPIVFGNNWPNRTADMGKNVLPKLVFRV